SRSNRAGSSRSWAIWWVVPWREARDVRRPEVRIDSGGPRSRRSARASREDGEKASARGAGRNLVEGAPVGAHDLPGDEGPPPGRAGSLDQEMHVAPSPRHAKRDGPVGVPLERLRDEVGDRLRDAIHVPFA